MAKDRDYADFKALDRDFWGPFLNITSLPSAVCDGPPDLDAVVADRSIRDLLFRYCYHYDAGDLDGVIDVFTPYAIVVNNRGTYVGADAIRENYRYLIEGRRFGFHQVTNTVIRLSPDRSGAAMTSFLFCVNVLHSGALNAVNGAYADRLVKTADGWRFSERRISAHFQYNMAAIPMMGGPGGPPQGSRPGNNREWFGAEYVL